jgi:Iap family predicted aminopeptidase
MNIVNADYRMINVSFAPTLHGFFVEQLKSCSQIACLGAPSYLMKHLGLLSPNIHSHTERIG